MIFQAMTLTLIGKLTRLTISRDCKREILYLSLKLIEQTIDNVIRHKQLLLAIYGGGLRNATKER